MQASHWKVFLLGVNIALAGGTAAMAGVLALRKPESYANYIAGVKGAALPVAKATQAEPAKNIEQSKKLFAVNWTAKPVKEVPVVPGEVKPVVPKVTPLDQIITLNLIMASESENAAVIITNLKTQKQEVLRVNQAASDVSPTATLLRVESRKKEDMKTDPGGLVINNLGQAIFKYNSEEVPISFKFEVKNPATELSAGSMSGRATEPVKIDPPKPDIQPIVRSGGKTFDSPAGGKAVYYEAGNEWDIPSSEVDYARKNQDLLKKEAKLGVYAPKGAVEGVKITELDPNGLAAGRGFRKGDIITKVNDIPMQSVDDIYGLQNNKSVTEAEKVRVDMIRDGTPVRVIFRPSKE